MPMPERLDRVTVQLLHGDVELPWASREQLLAELSVFEAANRATRAFEGAGASAPVRLTKPDKALLAEIITLWAERMDVDGLPEGLWELRNLLLDDVEHSA